MPGPVSGSNASSSIESTQPKVQDILSLRMAAHAPRACVLLGGEDGSAHRLVILDVEDGVLTENETLTPMVNNALSHKKVEKIKIAPSGDHLLINTLDMQTPGWARARQLISLPDVGLTTLASWPLDMPDVITQTFSSSASDGVLSYTHLYTPRDAARKIPLLVMLHAGPHEQHQQGYAPETAHFVGRGYSVAWVNYRGSTGRGKDFLDLKGPTRGAGEVDDVACAIKNLLSTHPALDASKVFVMGHSYGGYIALRLGGTFPDLMKGIVAIGGACIWKSDLAEPSQTPHSHADYSFYTEKSGAADYIEQITRPTLVFDAIQRDIVQQESVEWNPRFHASHHPKVTLLGLKSIGCFRCFQEAVGLAQVMLRAGAFTDDLCKGVVPPRRVRARSSAHATLVESEVFALSEAS